jgi:hypothetical protein
MKRREFIALLGSGVAGWPLASRAQQAAKLPTIGFLGANNASFAMASTDAFLQRLRELGWIENRTVAIEYRWAEGREARFAVCCNALCPLLAQSGHHSPTDPCPLLGVKRTSAHGLKTMK